MGQCRSSLTRATAEAPLDQLCLHPQTTAYSCYCSRATVATGQGKPEPPQLAEVKACPMSLQLNPSTWPCSSPGTVPRVPCYPQPVTPSCLELDWPQPSVAWLAMSSVQAPSCCGHDQGWDWGKEIDGYLTSNSPARQNKGRAQQHREFLGHISGVQGQ